MNRNFQFLAVLALVVFVVVGCGKKADANKPLEQVQKEAQSMSVNDLQKTAEAYAKEITSTKSELTKTSEELKKLSPKDLLGEKAKSIKDKISSLGSEASELTKRYEVYARAYKEKGGDVSKIALS